MKPKNLQNIALSSILAAFICGWATAETINEVPKVQSQFTVSSVLAPKEILAVEDTDEVIYLDRLADPREWAPAEASMNKAPDVDGHPAITLHIDVDHFGGEKAYPIGWPRTYLKAPNSINWKNFDKFAFKILAKSSRTALPPKTLNMKFARGGLKNFEVSFEPAKNNIKLNEWVEYVMPISKISQFPDFNSIGFYISESNYNHKDVLDFTFASFRLIRSTYCKVTAMRTDGIHMKNSSSMKLNITLEGPVADGSRGVPFEISQNGKIFRHETLPVPRGNSDIEIDMSELHIPVGDYILTAFPQNPERKLSVSFKVIDSPWEK